MRPPNAFALLWAVAMCTSLLGVTTSSAIVTHARQGVDLADELLTGDVVCIGTLVAAAPAERMTTFRCRNVSKTHPISGMEDLTIRVTKVLLGSLLESDITVTVLPGALRGRATGQPLLVKAIHSCDDDWRLWGTVYPLRTGMIEESPLLPPGARARGPRESIVGLERRLQERSREHALGRLNGSLALVLATVQEVAVDGDRSRLRAKSVAPILGPSVSFTGIVTLSERNCRNMPARGDTIVLNIPVGGIDSLDVSGCYDQLRVVGGTMRAFGVALGELGRQVITTPEGLQMRKPREDR